MTLELKKCPSCAALVGPMERYCVGCKHQLGLDCPRCDHFTPFWSESCMFCGRPILHHLQPMLEMEGERLKQERSLLQADIQSFQERLAYLGAVEKNLSAFRAILWMTLESAIALAAVIGVSFALIDIYEASIRGIYRRWPIRGTILITIAVMALLLPLFSFVSRHWRRCCARRKESSVRMRLEQRLVRAETQMDELSTVENASGESPKG